MPAYHTVPLSTKAHTAPAQPSLGTLRPWAPVEWWPARNVMVAQDTLVGCARRPLLSFGLAGSDDWAFADGASGPTAPDKDDWRVVYPATTVRLTPGSFLRLHVLFCPSGMASQPDSPLPIDAYPSGAVRVTVTWTAADGTTSGPHTFDADLPATTVDGDLPTTGAALWAHLAETEISEIWPPGANNTNATAATYSEGCRASVAISIQGGARIVDCTLYEYPSRHTQEHDQTDPSSCHGATMVGGEPPQSEMTPRPATRRRDATAYTERRYGTHQLLRTAHQQTEVLGPRILAWSPWLSDGASYTAENSLAENDVEPVIITGTTNLVELVSGASAYSAGAPGWLCHASHAQLARYSASRQVIAGGGRAVVPVRVQVRARWTGTTRGRVRVQSSATEWIDVIFDASGSKQTREAIGWLETQPAADVAVANIQAFGRNTNAGDSLEVYGLTVDWGWYT